MFFQNLCCEEHIFEMAAKSGLCTKHSETTPNWAEQLKGKKFAECELSKLERLPENAAHGLEMRSHI